MVSELLLQALGLGFVSSETKQEGEIEKCCPGARGRCARLGKRALLTTEGHVTAANKTTWPEHTKTHSKIDHLDFVQELIFLWLCASLTGCTYQGRVFPPAVGFAVPLCNSAQCNSENSTFSTYRLTLERACGSGCR